MFNDIPNYFLLWLTIEFLEFFQMTSWYVLLLFKVHVHGQLNTNSCLRQHGQTCHTDDKNNRIKYLIWIYTISSFCMIYVLTLVFFNKGKPFIPTSKAVAIFSFIKTGETIFPSKFFLKNRLIFTNPVIKMYKTTYSMIFLIIFLSLLTVKFLSRSWLVFFSTKAVLSLPFPNLSQYLIPSKVTNPFLHQNPFEQLDEFP